MAVANPSIWTVNDGRAQLTLGIAGHRGQHLIKGNTTRKQPTLRMTLSHVAATPLPSQIIPRARAMKVAPTANMILPLRSLRRARKGRVDHSTADADNDERRQSLLHHFPLDLALSSAYSLSMACPVTSIRLPPPSETATDLQTKYASRSTRARSTLLQS
ncbi:hypothetical protein GALMADRAFT_148533 [Galerina marginata CBS 339.88]|uniref:Uncharacterized protein n=1 Tax=Galerina marginata (strain CBS 339.88) TaxID=685588 RepID=A0A067SD02_GALM3|nr:hypothetical protein GALMADRAFT_148533 [Galerina marginata CBS 339.88]